MANRHATEVHTVSVQSQWLCNYSKVLSYVLVSYLYQSYVASQDLCQLVSLPGPATVEGSVTPALKSMYKFL